MSSIAGMQSHNKKELEKLLKGKTLGVQKSHKIVVFKKPSWWHGKWKTTYQIVKK